MSLQAMEAVLVELDAGCNVVSERSVAVELVQKGDILKVFTLTRFFQLCVEKFATFLTVLCCLFN